MKANGFEFRAQSLEDGPWVSSDYWVSHFNFDSEVSRYNFPSEISFHDVTLRDGEQTPGVVLRKSEKIEIAKKLDEIGIQRIEAGMPVVSVEDFEAVKEIAHLGLGARVIAFCRLLRDDIDAAIKCDVDGIICEGPVGIPKLRQFGWSYEQVTDKAIDAIEYAKAHGLWTAFFGVDGTRADPSFLKSLFTKLSMEVHPDAFVIVDTFGCATPEGFGKLVREIRKSVREQLEVHTHNDFGLATAVAISGLQNGASVVHTSVNGIGERAGNASFEEIAMVLRYLYGQRVSIKFDKLKELSELVVRHTGFNLAPNKPIVGDRVFTREAGISIAGWMKYHLGSEAYLPELVGNKHGVVIGKKSGAHSIEFKLREMGMSATQEQVQLILREVKHRSEQRKSAINDEEFRELAEKVILGARTQ